MPRKHPLANCDECPLASKGKYVPTKMPVSNDGQAVAFIGESPGRTESIKGEPFVGPSGKLLTNVLSKYGIDRDDVMLTNAANCAMPNIIDKSDLPKAIECCRPRLLHELDRANVGTAVTLGNAAVSSLIETRVGITKLRGGPARPSTYEPSINVVPTFHPAACLRSQAMFPHMVTDIGKISSKPSLWVDPEIKVITSVKDALRLLNDLDRVKSDYPLVVDIESGTEKDESVEKDVNLLCVGLGSMNPKAGNSVIVIGQPAIKDKNIQTRLCGVLAKRGVVAQYGQHDITVLRQFNRSGFPLLLTDDTLLKSYCLNETPGIHKLGYMGVEYLGAPPWKETIKKFLKKLKDSPETRRLSIEHIRHSLRDGPVLRTEVLKVRPMNVQEAAIKRAASELEVKEFKDLNALHRPHQIRWSLPSHKVEIANYDADGSYASIPSSRLHTYNAFDVQATRLLRNYFDDRMKPYPELQKLNKFLIDGSNALCNVQSNGLKVNIEYNMQLEDQLVAELEEISSFPFNPNSSKAIIDYFNTVLNMRTASVDKEFLLGITGDDVNPPKVKASPDVVDLCKGLQKYRKASRFKSTNVTAIREKALRSPDHIVYPTFSLHKTTTGRLSSESPNAQNIPRFSAVKKQYIPTKSDRVFVQVDYSQLELRVLTWLAKDEYMRSLFMDVSRDVFVELCTAVYSDRFVNAGSEERKELRTLIKTMAYGLAYGRGAAAIAQAFNIPLEEAIGHTKSFYAMVPDIMRFQASVVKQVKSGKDLITPFGRHRRFHLITEDNKVDVENQAKAFQPQSIGSDCCLLALMRLPDSISVHNIIHDAILAEAHRDEAEEVAKTISETMINTAEETTEGYVPFRTETKIGENWAEVS